MEQDTKKQLIQYHFQSIMETLGLDLSDDSLHDTPKRVAKMYVDELFYGLDKNAFPKMTTTSNSMGYDQILVVKDIKVNSICEHHFVPIIGVAHIGYKPKNKVLGLSKFNRLVDYFSRRPQIQERLTQDIWKKLQEILDTEDVAVIIDADHTCVRLRGIKDINSSTITSAVGGCFRTQESARNEFFKLINFKK